MEGQQSPIVGMAGGTHENRANDLMKAAVARLIAHHSIRATLRQQIRMFGNTLVGSGEYRQLSHNRDLLFRTDLKIQLEDRSSVFQEICDGRFLWRYQNSPSIDDLGTFRQQLQQIDLDEVRRAVPTGKIAPRLGVGLGGLPRLMSQLQEHFVFDAILSGTMQDVPVWMVSGEWRPEALVALLPPSDHDRTIDESYSRLPEQIPHSVTLRLGKDDLFPYRIEFWRRTADRAQNGIAVSSNRQRIVVLELFEVEFDIPIHPSKFDRGSVDIPFVDGTAEYLEQNGLTIPEP